MTDQQSTHAALVSAVQTFYSKKALKDFEPSTAWYKQAPVKEPIPLYEGATVVFTRYKKIAALYADNSNEFTAQQMFLSAVTVSATLHERDGYVQLSRRTVLTTRNSALDRAAEKVRSAGAKTVDKLVRNDIGMMVADVANASSLNYANMAIDGGSLNSTGITARLWSHDKATGGDRFPMYHNKTRVAQSALVTSIAKSGLTVRTIQHGVSVLESKDVEPVGGYFTLITHPTASFQITTSAGFKSWFNYTTSEPLKNKPSEVGVIAGTKIVNTTLALRFPLSGDTMSTASGALYASLLFGDEAYGCSMISGEQSADGFQFFLKESGPQSTNDPTNKIRQAGFAVQGVGMVLNKSAGLWLLTTDKV